MNFDRILNRFMSMFTKKATNWGVKKGTEMVAGKGKPQGQMTAAERQQANKSREAAKLARKAAKITRKLGR